MSELKKITQLYADLYNGSPWLDINIADTLKTIDADKASKHFSAETNSIWQIVNHLVYWRNTVFKRVALNETISSDAQNGFYEIDDISETAWAATLKAFEKSQHQWLKFLNDSDESVFDKIYEPNHQDYYYMINGILQHDAYHLGQIVFLKKLL